MKARKTSIAFLVLLAVAAGGLGGESLSPEVLLPLHEARDSYTPGAAFGQDVFLVVWQSGRLGPGDIRKGVNCIGDIAGCRVGKDGKALDAKPLVVSGAADLQEHPRVVFGKDRFLVVWQDLRNGRDWDVYAARVAADGKVLDPEGILVSGGAHNQALPRVAWDGKAFHVVWQDFRCGNRYEVYGARVSLEGRVLDAQGVLLATSKGEPFNRYTPDVASPGEGRSYVTWCGNAHSSGGEVFGGRFVLDGAAAKEQACSEDIVRSPVRKEGGAGRQANPIRLAAGPKGYLLMWTTFCPSGRGTVRGCDAALFDAGGKRTKSLEVAGMEGRMRDPDVCWDGSAFVAAWHNGECASGVPKAGGRHDGVFLRRILPDGSLPAAPLEVAGTFASPAAQACVASDGSGTTLVAYERHPEKAETPITVAFRLLTAK